MISSAIWNKQARVNFQRPTKVHEPVWRVHFVVLEKFTSAYLFQIAREKSCDYLLMINTKNITTTTNFDSARVFSLFN